MRKVEHCGPASPLSRHISPICVAKQKKGRAALPLVLPNSVAAQAAEYADADGVSLDQFIATAVAEKVGSLRAASAEAEASLKFRNTARQAVFNARGTPIMRDDLKVPRCQIYRRHVRIDAAS
jgi:hypothetical protein